MIISYHVVSELNDRYTLLNEWGGAKDAVHGIGEALCTLGAVWIVCVQAAGVKAYQQAPFFMVVTFVVITFISNTNYTEWFHKAA